MKRIVFIVMTLAVSSALYGVDLEAQRFYDMGRGAYGVRSLFHRDQLLQQDAPSSTRTAISPTTLPTTSAFAIIRTANTK
jgi:hypothetical protein